jgi:type IV secretory pathway component VirB8
VIQDLGVPRVPPRIIKVSIRIDGTVVGQTSAMDHLLHWAYVSPREIYTRELDAMLEKVRVAALLHLDKKFSV